MIIPTATNLKAVFPEFADQPDAAVEFAIEQASRNVDDSWLEKDRTLALLFLSAHYLMVGIQRSQSATGQIVTGERMGEMSVNYGSIPGPGPNAMSDLDATLYGIRFKELANINFPSVAVI